jgi:hypothetical protein
MITMKRLAFVITALLSPAASALAQTAGISGQVVLADGGQPLGYTVVSNGERQLLTNESGKFFLSVAPGDVKLRFKRIGFAPKDTTIHLEPGDALSLRVALSRLVIQLPAMLVSGKCTNEMPLAEKPAVLAELFDQVHQNAERVRLLAKQQPFVMFVYRLRGFRDKSNRIVASSIDTVVRNPLPAVRYVPKKVLRPDGAGSLALALPELPDIADTAFTNHHCFTYAGQTRWESDSVVKVDFEPTPWLNKQVDIRGSLFLKLDGYQLVGSITSLNRIPPSVKRGGVEDVTVRAKFTEIVSGIPVLDEWEFVSRYQRGNEPRIEIGQVFNLKWDSAAVEASLPRPPSDGQNVTNAVQRFYNAYLLLRGRPGMDAKALVMASEPPVLGAPLMKLLRDDDAARKQQPAPTREVLGFDPFLGSQGSCPRVAVANVRVRGDTAAANVFAICPAAGKDSVGTTPLADVLLARSSGQWIILDFDRAGGSLVQVLCGYAMADREPARRPATCPE